MIILLLIIFVLLLLNPGIVAECVLVTCKTWLYKLVPILYPNFIIIDFLAQDQKMEMLSIYLFKPLHKLLGIRFFKSSMIVLLSFICGAPASTKFIKNALEFKDIDYKEANALLYSCSCFSLPYSIYILNCFQLNIPLFYILFLLSSFAILRFFSSGSCQNQIQFKKEKINYGNILINSITKNIDILISILGIMIFFNIILSLFKIDLRIYSFFEVLNGHSLLLTLNINQKLKEFLLVSSLSFLGISVHMQMFYVYPNLKYGLFFAIKLIQGLLIGLCFIFFSSFF